MKKLLLAAGLIAFGGQATAFAADIAPMPSAVDWSGAYIGAHIGYGFGDQDWTLVDNPGGGAGGSIGEVVSDHDIKGLLGGLQFGYNWQSDSIVIGIEAEAALSGIGGDDSRIAGGNNPGPREWESEINWMATVGPRLGYAFDSTLLYAEGGLAIADEDHYHLGANAREFNGGETHFGWFMGAGLEQAFSDSWSGRIEYNYVDLSEDNVELDGNPPNPAVFDIDQNLHVIKVGLNYRFGM